MEGYEKTTNLKLNKFDDNTVFGADPVTDNFEKIDDEYGKLNRKIDEIDLEDAKITCTAKDNKKLDVVLQELLNKDFSSFAKKGEILPQDIKGNNDKRIYKYVVMSDRGSDNPYLWVEYVDYSGQNVTEKYYYKDMKLIKDINANIESNKNKISALEVENASLKQEMSNLKKELANNNEQFKKLNELLKSLVGGDN